jgi:hypothetical protein
VSQVEEATALTNGARERAAPVAEELALEQRPGDGGTVLCDERPIRPVAAAVDQVGQQFLASTGLPDDQQRKIADGDTRGEMKDPAHPRVPRQEDVLTGRRRSPAEGPLRRRWTTLRHTAPPHPPTVTATVGAAMWRPLPAPARSG